MCFCCRQLLLFVWSQYQRSESYNFLMCPLTTEPTCLISCRCVCVCVLVNPTVSHGMFDFMPPSLPSFSHFLWAVVILPQLTPICVCAHTHTRRVGAWTPESQRHPLIRPGAPPLSDDCLCGTLLYCQTRSKVAGGGGIGGCQPWTWVDSRGCRCAQKNNPSVKYTAASLLVREVLTVSISSSNSGTSGQWGLKLQGGVGDCDTTVIEDLRRAGFCMGSDVGYGVRM